MDELYYMVNGEVATGDTGPHSQCYMFGWQVLRCQDVEMLSLDLHGVVAKCPDMSEEQLCRLVALRGDVPRARVKDTVAIALAARPHHRPNSHPSLFANITFQDRLLAHFAI